MFTSIFRYLRSHKALLAQVALVVVFVGALIWGASIPKPPPDEPDVPFTATTTSLQVTPQATVTPAEATPNQNETDGIIFAGVLLVLIIVVGTLGVINQRD